MNTTDLPMKALEVIAKTREYLDYVERHINNVARAYEELMTAMERVGTFPVSYDDSQYCWLRDEVMNHDVSKLSEEEFVAYRAMFYPTEEEKKSSVQGSFNTAWEHHWQNNSHHWENWTTKDYYHPHQSSVHCTHMVIDWLAMSYEFGDTPRSYYEKNKDRIKLPEWAVNYINELFDALETP